MSEPLDIPRFIQLMTDESLPTQVIAGWYHCVRRHAPSGVVIAVPTKDEHDKPTTVLLVHRTTENHHCYLVPLSRDLTADEVESIVRKFAKQVPDLDFEVETNETTLVANEYGEVSLDAAKHAMLCMALAKQQHEDWMRDQTDDGWRYGTTLDPHAKTHPLLRPWDQISDRFRKTDLGVPQSLLKLLNKHGYGVLHREDLNRLLSA